MKNPIFAPFFWKRQFLEKLPDNWAQKQTHTHTHTHTHNDNWAKKSPETPIFIVRKWPWTSYWLWLGPVVDFENPQTWTSYWLHSIYMLWSYYLVQVWGFWKLWSGPSRGFWSYYLVHVCFLAYKNSGFKRFGLHTQLSFCVFLCPIIWQFSKNSLFFKKRVQKLGFSIFSVLSLNFENSPFLGLLKHYKNRGFSNFWCFYVVEREENRQKKW